MDKTIIVLISIIHVTLAANKVNDPHRLSLEGSNA